MNILKKRFKGKQEPVQSELPKKPSIFWYAKDCCLMCIAHPVESLSLSEYSKKISSKYYFANWNGTCLFVPISCKRSYKSVRKKVKNERVD